MKVVTGAACFVLCLCLVGGPRRATAQDGQQQKPPSDTFVEHQPKKEQFAALAYMPSGAGRSMVGPGATASVDLYVKRYTSHEEARRMAGLLNDGGPDALLKALQKADSIGKITLTGRVGFYDLKLIRSHKTPEGRRIYALGDRPVGFLEAYGSGRTMDYPFGILMLELKRDKKGKEKGEGVLMYAAKVKVLDGKKLDVENYGIDPVRLMAVRKL
jgi:hypothetical protein